MDSLLLASSSSETDLALYLQPRQLRSILIVIDYLNLKLFQR